MTENNDGHPLTGWPFVVVSPFLWTRASINGCELTEHFPDIDDVVMVGYNN